MRLSEIADAAEFASAAEHAIDTISYFLRAGGKVTLEGEGDHDENTLGVFAEITYRDGSKQVAGCAELLDTLGKIAEKLRAEGDEQGGGEVEAEGTVDRCLVCGGVFADNPRYTCRTCSDRVGKEQQEAKNDERDSEARGSLPEGPEGAG